MPAPHAFAGSYHATQRIPAWEKGSKLSDTSEDDFKDGYYDSSDVSAGCSSDTDDDGDLEPASFDADEAIASLVLTANNTPVKHKHDVKGKGRQILPDGLTAPADEVVVFDHGTPTLKSKATFKSSTSTASGRTHTHRPYRPRSGSSSRQSSRKSTSPVTDDAIAVLSSPRTAAGPAAQSFSDFTKEQTSTDAPSTSSRMPFARAKAVPISNAHPLRDAAPVWGKSPTGIPLRTHGRGLDRARSAPMSVFGGPIPSPRTPSTRPHGTPSTNNLQTPDVRPHSPDPECDCWRCDPSVQAAKEAERVIDEAKLRSDGQVCLDSRSLTYIPECIKDMDMLVSEDKHSRRIRPIDIHLFLASNALTEEGIPQAVWNMRNIVQLGLRFNQIREIPQAIGDMAKLKHLVLFNNKMRWLPAEITQLHLDTLVVGSNPFVRMPQAASAAPAEEAAAATIEETSARKHICEARQPNFRVPTLLEIVTRKLLEPLPSRRNAPVSTSLQATPAASVRRYFHEYKDEATSPRVGSTLLPPHLLKPFIPLLRPNLPQHLISQAAEFDRSLQSSPPSSPGGSTTDAPLSAAERRSASRGNTRDLLLCSVCKTACGEMAEARIEWRREIAGVTLASEEAKSEWVSILWRGCSVQCLDFLDE